MKICEKQVLVEIGELLKRSPGEVFQYWKLMQQNTKATDHTGHLSKEEEKKQVRSHVQDYMRCYMRFDDIDRLLGL